MLLIQHQCPVEIGERISGIQLYRLVHIRDRIVIIPCGSIKPAPAHIPLGVKTVQPDRLVVVIQSFCSITQKKPTCTPVEIGCRILGLFPDIPVKILYRILKLLRKEICHSTAEIKSDKSRTKVYGRLEIVQSLIISAEPAQCDGPVMIARSKHRIEAD